MITRYVTNYKNYSTSKGKEATCSPDSLAQRPHPEYFFYKHVSFLQLVRTVHFQGPPICPDLDSVDYDGLRLKATKAGSNTIIQTAN